MGDRWDGRDHDVLRTILLWIFLFLCGALPGLLLGFVMSRAS